MARCVLADVNMNDYIRIKLNIFSINRKINDNNTVKIACQHTVRREINLGWSNVRRAQKPLWKRSRHNQLRIPESNNNVH